MYSQTCSCVVTSIKQSPVLKDHLLLVVIENFIWIEPLLRGHLSYKAIFSMSQKWPLNTGLTVHVFSDVQSTVPIQNKQFLNYPLHKGL
jgi:hypothetical protein